MNVPTHPTRIKAMLDARVKKLAPQCPPLTASLVVINKHCGRPGCHCQTGEGHPGHYLTYNEKGKTRTVYVPLDMVEEVSAWVNEKKRLKVLSQEISQLAIALVRTHVKARKRKAGRP